MRKLMKLFRGVPARREPVLRRATGPMTAIEIVGESSHRDHIRGLRRRYGEGDFDIVLVPEPQNPYDGNAVEIYVDGAPVGHLSRETAPAWQPMVTAANAQGFIVTGTGSIWGASSEKPNLGVFAAAPWAGRGPAPRDRFGG
jgi:hypothetical protein